MSLLFQRGEEEEMARCPRSGKGGAVRQISVGGKVSNEQIFPFLFKENFIICPPEKASIA